MATLTPEVSEQKKEPTTLRERYIVFCNLSDVVSGSLPDDLNMALSLFQLYKKPFIYQQVSEGQSARIVRETSSVHSAQGIIDELMNSNLGMASLSVPEGPSPA